MTVALTSSDMVNFCCARSPKASRHYLSTQPDLFRNHMCGKSPSIVGKRGDPQCVQNLHRLWSKLRRVDRSVRVNARSPPFVSIDDQQIRLSAWMKALKGTLSSELRAKGCAS